MLEDFFSPISIAFAVLIVGYLLGRIKVCGMSLDLAGILIAAVTCGYLISIIDAAGNTINVFAFKDNMQMFSSLGTSLFVSVIGITTGYSLNLCRAKNLKAILIGALMVLSSFVLMNLIILFDTDVSHSKLVGALCGALTTTPGLSAAHELKGVVAEEATIGYGCTYLFGVMATVLFVQLITRKSEALDNKAIQSTAATSKAALGGLIQIGIVVILGRFIGNIRFGSFSFGNSGGILCVGIVLGVIVKVVFSQRTASSETMGIYRNFGLIIFFVGNGVPAGMSLNNGFDMKIIMYGVLMTIVPIITGTLLSRLIAGNSCIASVIAGGMTSTPAIGVLLQKRCHVQLDSYSMAYVGALLTIIVLIRIL